MITLYGCNLQNPNVNFTNKPFILIKGTGVIIYGTGTWDYIVVKKIELRKNNTGQVLTFFQGEENVSEVDWSLDRKRNWIKITAMGSDKAPIYFSYENDQLKMVNTSKVLILTNLEEFAITDFKPKTEWAKGHIKNNSVNLRYGPGTDYRKTLYSDASDFDCYVIDKKKEWYKIAIDTKNTAAFIQWVHKDYFVVTKAGKLDK